MINTKKVGYLGPEGTFSNEAVLQVTDDSTLIIAYDTIMDIFVSLENGEIDEAIVPIENSTQGSVLVTLDLLTEYNFKVKAELFLPIKHNLLVQKGKKLDDITVICSHSQAIAQCRNYISNVQKQVHSMSSTANAARYVTEISTAAVIGSKVLSEKYDLDILEENIQDYDNNVTRFVLISAHDNQEITGHDKTSIIISLYGDKPGGLYEVLYEFARNNINLTKIESRPSKKGMGKYIFFIDLEGHRNNVLIENALKDIQRKVEFFKIIGSYNQINVGGN